MTSNYFPMHKAVFNNDWQLLSSLLQDGKIDVKKKDKHGNTALHLAVMLGRKECVKLLLNHAAPILFKNNSSWTPLDEALSYGDRTIVSFLFSSFLDQTEAEMKNECSKEVDFLKMQGDFIMELKWEFSSWLPLISRILPRDICKISKRGEDIRLDTTLAGFSKMKWKRGDITFLRMGDSPQQRASYWLDNKRKTVKVLVKGQAELNCDDLFGLTFEESVNFLMSNEITHANISTKPITFTRAQSGWLFRVNRNEMVGKYNADFYNVNGISLKCKSRREHLTAIGLKKIPEVSERRVSLSSPISTNISWEQYLDKDTPPILGRKHVYEEKSYPVTASIAMSKDIPLGMDILLVILEIIAPHFEHFNKLRDFVEKKLPPGFPVKIKIPVFPSINANVTITDFKWQNNLPDYLFTIQNDYRDDNDYDNGIGDDNDKSDDYDDDESDDYNDDDDTDDTDEYDDDDVDDYDD